MNSDIDIKIRKYKNNLAIGGKSYIIFGVWAIVKMIMQLTMTEGDMNLDTMIDQTMQEGMDRAFVEGVYIIVFAIIMAFIMLIHLMVGRNAVRFGRGHNNRKRFYIYTSIVALINIVSFVIYPIGIKNGTVPVDETLIASILVDLSVAFLLVDLFYSAIMIEICTKKKSLSKEA